MRNAGAKVKKTTLTDFIIQQKRPKCKVCDLPPEVHKQIRNRSKKFATVPVILQWLKSAYGAALTPHEFLVHQRVHTRPSRLGRKIGRR
jgi:hypothetical protein